MKRDEFGNLIKALRRECLNENLKSLSQEELATRTGLGVRTISRIEGGDDSVKLQGNDLLKLADALRLTTGERKEFFLAATAIESEKVPLNRYDPTLALDKLIELTRKASFPGYIVDCYFDVIAINSAVLSLYTLTAADVYNVTSHSKNFNILRFLFSPEFKKQQEMMSEDWKNIAYYYVMNFRTYSLRYRATSYFMDLLGELLSYPKFKNYWYKLSLIHDCEYEDHIFDGGHIHLKTETWGELEYLGMLYTALTMYGMLQLCVYVPASPRTLVEFGRMNEQSDGNIYCLSTWPKHRASHD